MSFYGGIFSVLPAYIADLYGQKHAGAIHGAALTAWAASAVCGPMGLARLRAHAEQSAIGDLLGKVCTVRHDVPHAQQGPRRVTTTSGAHDLLVARFSVLVGACQFGHGVGGFGL